MAKKRTRNSIFSKADIRHSKVLILGLGSYPQGTGVSSAIYFAKQGCDVLATDLKTAEQIGENVKTLEKFKNVRFRLGENRIEDVEWADIVVKNPGIPRKSEMFKRAVELQKPIINDITIFLEKSPCLVIGITGTRGKSTTTSWIADMLKRSGKTVYVGGNITVSPLTFLAKLKKKDIAVVELSSWMLETCGLNGVSPQIAVWTNVMNDHLNTYEGLEDYAEAKAQIMRNQKPGDLFVANLDDKFVSSYVAEAPGKISGFSMKKQKDSSAWVKNGKIIALIKDKEVEILPVTEIGLAGQHNVMNALGSIVSAIAAGATPRGIRESLKKFGGVPFRQEKIAVKKGIEFINDTTATTPDAAIAALNAFAQPKKSSKSSMSLESTGGLVGHGGHRGLESVIHWICGGADKGLDFSELAGTAKGKKLKIHVLVGTAQEKLTRALKSKKLSFEVHDSLADAFHSCVTEAKEGDCVLLSPACASFGLFKNEFDRGAQFNALVEQWKG